MTAHFRTRSSVATPGRLAAYVVDTETSELHPQLSDGQRMQDVMVAEENLVGELLDVTAEGLVHGLDPMAAAEELRRRYDGLWSELDREVVFAPDQRYRVEERVQLLNSLGFDVEEVEVVAHDGAYSLRLQPRVVEPGHHVRTLQALTGLEVQENQARRLLGDLARYRTELEATTGGPVSEMWRRAAGSPMSSSRRSRPCRRSSVAASSRPNCSIRCSTTAGTSRKQRVTTSVSTMP